MKTYQIAAMGGDGIGPDVIKAGCRVLQALADKNGNLALQFQDFDWGSDYYRRTGRMMPEDGLDTLKPFHAIFFGAVGDAHPGGKPENAAAAGLAGRADATPHAFGEAAANG